MVPSEAAWKATLAGKRSTLGTTIGFGECLAVLTQTPSKPIPDVVSGARGIQDFFRWGRSLCSLFMMSSLRVEEFHEHALVSEILPPCLVQRVLGGGLFRLNGLS